MTGAFGNVSDRCSRRQPAKMTAVASTRAAITRPDVSRSDARRTDASLCAGERERPKRRLLSWQWSGFRVGLQASYWPIMRLTRAVVVSLILALPTLALAQD